MPPLPAHFPSSILHARSLPPPCRRGNKCNGLAFPIPLPTIPLPEFPPRFFPQPSNSSAKFLLSLLFQPFEIRVIVNRRFDRPTVAGGVARILEPPAQGRNEPVVILKLPPELCFRTGFPVATLVLDFRPPALRPPEIQQVNYPQVAF